MDIMEINRIGIIGLGIMGKPMARNLLKANFKLGLYARNTTSLEGFSDKHVETFSSPAELAKHCQIIISIVADSPDVKEVITGNNGILDCTDSRVKYVIDMSTISPEVTRDLAQKLADKNISMLDAPVSGGELGAIDGTLSIMVGGQEESFQRVLPILKCLGKNIVHIGEHGAGQVAKACNQILVAQTMSAVAEAILLAESSGVDANKVRDALLGGFANSKILEVHGKRMLDDSYAPGFKALLHNKDLGIALHSAKENGISLPGAKLVANYMQQAVERGDGEYDSAVIAKIIFAQGK